MNSLISLFTTPKEKFLGQGAEGIVYLKNIDSKHPQDVVKIIPCDTKEFSDGDRFSLEILPTLNKEIQKHFVKVYSITFVDKDPLQNLKHLHKHIDYDFYDKNAKFFKVIEMEYGGKSVNTKNKEIFSQLLVPVLVLNSTGYHHLDLINSGNIVVQSTKDGDLYKIIDYDNMKFKPEMKVDVFQILNYLILWRDRLVKEFPFWEDWYTEYKKVSVGNPSNYFHLTAWEDLFDQKRKAEYYLNHKYTVPEYVYTEYLYPLKDLQKVYELCYEFDTSVSSESEYIKLAKKILLILRIDI